MTTSRRLAPKLILAACILACAAPLTQSVAHAASWGIGSERVQGSGKIVRQQREIGHFTGVSNGLAAHVEIRIGNTESVTVETDDNLLPLVETVVEDGMLKIQTTRRNLNLQTRNMKIIVQAKSVDHISLGGSGAIDSDTLRGRKVEVELGGSGNIRLNQFLDRTACGRMGLRCISKLEPIDGCGSPCVAALQAEFANPHGPRGRRPFRAGTARGSR